MNVCTCRDSFVTHSNGKDCLKGEIYLLALIANLIETQSYTLVATMHMATCQEHSQCTTAFGNSMECRYGKCQCVPTHRFQEYQNRCIQSKSRRIFFSNYSGLLLLLLSDISSQLFSLGLNVHCQMENFNDC
jgi:hypothetical protein